MRRRKEKVNLFVIFVVATLLLSFLYTNCAPGNSSHESSNGTQSEESGVTGTTETTDTSLGTENEDSQSGGSQSEESGSASESENESESEETINVEGISLNQDTLIFGGGN